ncbi:MAG: hypothetical protein ACPG3X_08480, partial [Opitutales bacterium]
SYAGRCRAAACRTPSHRGTGPFMPAAGLLFVGMRPAGSLSYGKVCRHATDRFRLCASGSGNANAVPTAGTTHFGTTSSLRYSFDPSASLFDDSQGAKRPAAGDRLEACFTETTCEHASDHFVLCAPAPLREYSSHRGFPRPSSLLELRRTR